MNGSVWYGLVRSARNGKEEEKKVSSEADTFYESRLDVLYTSIVRIKGVYVVSQIVLK